MEMRIILSEEDIANIIAKHFSISSDSVNFKIKKYYKGQFGEFEVQEIEAEVTKPFQS